MPPPTPIGGWSASVAKTACGAPEPSCDHIGDTLPDCPETNWETDIDVEAWQAQYRSEGLPVLAVGAAAIAVRR